MSEIHPTEEDAVILRDIDGTMFIYTNIEFTDLDNSLEAEFDVRWIEKEGEKKKSAADLFNRGSEMFQELLRKYLQEVIHNERETNDRSTGSASDTENAAEPDSGC